MSRAALALACLACAGQGRRVQTSLSELQSRQFAAEHEELLNVSVPIAQSLAEVKSAFKPSALQVRSAKNSGLGVSQTTLTRKALSVDGVPRAHAPLDNQHFAAANIPEWRRATSISMNSHATSGDTHASEEEKEPWYAYFRNSALLLVTAKVLTRATIGLRKRSTDPAMHEASARSPLRSIDFPLILGVALWYLGNYKCNVTTKIALKVAGGSAGFPLTIATLQLAVGAIYAVFLWLAPDARQRPTITFKDYLATLPVGITAGYAHASTHFALSAGSVSFSQIVKTAEPVFVALLGTLVYGASVSKAKWLCLIPVIGGVTLATIGELQFSWAALVTASLANLFAAVKGNENKKLMTTPGIKDRLGSVGNQFAITMINSTLVCIPLMLLREGHKLGEFVDLCRANPVVPWNILISGLWFNLYSELATRVVKKTGAVTQSVLNTAKRVIVIIVVAILLGESLGPLKLAGCLIGIGGVFLYSVIDRLVAKKESKPSH